MSFKFYITYRVTEAAFESIWIRLKHDFSGSTSGSIFKAMNFIQGFNNF